MFECLEIPSLIPERYEREGSLMFNRKDGPISDRADLPYKQRMELLEKQRTGELQKADRWRWLGSIGLVFVLACVIVDLFPLDLAYSAAAVTVAGVALLVQRQSTHVGGHKLANGSPRHGQRLVQLRPIAAVRTV